MSRVKLREVAEIIVGYPFESAAFNLDGKGVRLVRGMNVTERSFRFGEDTRWWNDFTINLDRYYLKEFDILIGMDGSKVGKNFALVNKEQLPLLLVQRVACIRAKQNVNQLFLWFCISGKQFTNYIETVKTGSSIPHISAEQIGNFEINLPSIDVQNKIADALSQIENKILLNNKINENLEAMAKTIYDYCFLQFDFPNEEGKPYKSSGGKMVWNEELQREIPEGWENGYIKDFIEICNGKDHKELEDGNIPVYGSGGIIRTVNKYLYSGESVLIPRKGTLNNVIYVNEQFWTVDTMFYSILKKVNSGFYTYYSVKLNDFEKLNTGTGVPSMTTAIIYSLKVVIPPDEVLKSFDEKMQAIYGIVKHNRAENRELGQLRDFLLPLLMNGQVGFRED